MTEKIKTLILLLSLISCMAISSHSRAQSTGPSIIGKWTEASVTEIKRFNISDHTDTVVTVCSGCFVNFTSDMHYHYEAMHSTSDGIYLVHGNSLKETTDSFRSMTPYTITTLTGSHLVIQHSDMAADSSQNTLTVYNFTR